MAEAPTAVLADLSAMRAALETYLTHALPAARDVRVSGLRRMRSVGNAREPWEFTVEWKTAEGGGASQPRHIDVVMLVLPKATQVEGSVSTEFGMLREVYGTGLPVARPVCCDPTGTVLGRAFLATERLPGHADNDLIVASGPVAEAVLRDLAAVAARLHSLRFDPNRMAGLEPPGPEPAALVQLAHWNEIFRRNRDAPWPELAYAFRLLRATAPAIRASSLIHGDLRVPNVMYEQDRVTGLLDWELVHFGDPMEDLAWMYRSIWAPERALPFADFLDAYAHAGGTPIDAERLRWYRLFSLVKHSVISITGAHAFMSGGSDNIRLADRAATVVPFMAEFFQLTP
jgi:aminoglycoside phosphotransferase (APT) family kinase protein